MAARVLASIVESSDDAIISKSLDGVIQSWNAAAERLFGYTAEQAVGRHISLVIPPDRLAEEDHIHRQPESRASGSSTSKPSALRSDGRRDPRVAHDLADQRRGRHASLARRRSCATSPNGNEPRPIGRNFVTLVENSTDFIGICDLEGVPFFVNRAGLEMVGLDGLEEARRVPVASFFFPEDQPRIMEEFFPSVLEPGHGEIEVRFRHFKTGEARWMAYKVLTLPDADGRPIAFATVSQDITERKRLEDNLRSLAADLSEADRRKDEFLAMLAHELRNPLAPIRNALRALRLGGRRRRSAALGVRA